jgi:hypothetical protein
MNTNQDIFGYSRPTLVLEEPPRELWDDMTTKIESTHNKPQLLRMAETFAPWFSNYGEILRARPGETAQKAWETIDMMKSSTIKTDIAHGVALILASHHNLQAYVDSLSDGMRLLWRKVLIKNYVSQNSAKKYLNTKNKLINDDSRYYYYNQGGTNWNRREMGWFQTSTHLSERKSSYSYYHEREPFITVSATIRGIFFPYFFPELNHEDIAFAELPANTQWRTIELEKDSVANFKLLNSLIQQGELPMKKKGIGITDMKRALKKLNLEEIFSNDNNEYHQNLRAYNYIQVLATNEHKKNNNKKKLPSYEDTLKDLFSNFEKQNNLLTTLFYPHIKGLRQSITQWSRQERLCMLMFKCLKEEPQQWVGITNIMMRITELESDGTSSHLTTLVFHPYNERDMNELTNEYAKHFITVEKYLRDFGYTGLQACAIMLCSLGMAEVALNESENKHLSPFDQVDYLRLTPLGRYVLGIDSQYEAPKIEQVAYFELDPQRLIIRSLVEPNPYAQLLLDTSKRISNNRFETSAMSFLNNCSSREDLEGKISIFRQFIADKLPPLWEQFFQQLLQRCHPLTEDRCQYKHYTINPDNSELIQLLTTDPVLRPSIILAEGYRLLVKIEDVRKFETQMKKHGYLL